MRRFRKLLIDATAGAPAFTRPGADALARVGRALSPDDVAEVLDELDQLARERHAIPEWDGDASDAIALWQEDLARMLAATRGTAREALAADTSTREEMTRRYVGIAQSIAAAPGRGGAREAPPVGPATVTRSATRAPSRRR